MATEVKQQARGGALYETDFCTLAKEQPALLRADRFRELDLDHRVEVEDVGGAPNESFRSHVQTMIEFLPKLQHLLTPRAPRRVAGDGPGQPPT